MDKEKVPIHSEKKKNIVIAIENLSPQDIAEIQRKVKNDFQKVTINYFYIKFIRE